MCRCERFYSFAKIPSRAKGNEITNYRQNNKQQYEKDFTLHAYAADDGSDDFKDLPADVKNASCLLTFTKGDRFNLTVLLNGSVEQMDMEMKLTLDGVWNYEKGGKLKVDDLKLHLELTDIKIPSDMMDQLALLGQTEASVKQMFNNMLNEKAKDYMSSEELKKLNELNILSINESTMTVDNDSEKVVFVKVTE